MSRHSTRAVGAGLAAIALLVLAACTAPASLDALDAPAPEASDAAPSAGHGEVVGATEVAEPPLHLIAIDAGGQVAMLDLLEDTASTLEAGEAATSVTTDGRYVFAANDQGLSIIDSGLWTWDHVDHFHYYEAEPRILPRLTGEGVARVSTGMLSTAGTTGVFFPGSGDAVLLDNQALARGEIEETLRVETRPHAGLMVPLGSGAVITAAGGDELPDHLRVITGTGTDAGTEIASIACPDAAGSITTRLAVVIGCADGAVLVTSTDGVPLLTHVPYPEGAHPAATSFSARKGRPTVAGLVEDNEAVNGIWLLDTREQRWQWLSTVTPVADASAVDDADDHVVTLGTDGTVQVYQATSGQLLATTAPILADSLADPALAPHITLTVDGQRAYVNAAADETGGTVFEIDYADSARIARELTLPVRPLHLAEVGR